MDWSSLSCTFQLPVDAAAVPNMRLLLPQTASRFPSITEVETTELAYAPECSFYKKDWVGKTNRTSNWLQSRFPRLLRHMRNRPNIFSIEIPIKDKFYQGQDLKEKIHSPEFRVTWFIPSSAKVEWSKSPSGSVEEIEAKSSIQPFARSPDLFSKWTEPRYHIQKRDTAISDGCTPPLDRSIRAWKDPIGPLLLRDILSRPPRVNTP